MSKKTVCRTLLAIPVLLFLYLAIAMAWAWASLGGIMSAAPPFKGSTGLNASQTAILLKIEDPAFAVHKGLSLANGQGLTTISSAVARDVLLFSSDLSGIKGTMQSFYRAVFACCKKVDLGRDVTALVLDAKVPKEQQLAMYVTGVYMGTHEGMQLRGLHQAGQAYFGSPLDKLGDHQFAALVAMIKAPNQFHPRRHPEAHAARLLRVQAVLGGTCKPAGWFDTTYAHCGKPGG